MRETVKFTHARFSERASRIAAAAAAWAADCLALPELHHTEMRSGDIAWFVERMDVFLEDLRVQATRAALAEQEGGR